MKQELLVFGHHLTVVGTEKYWEEFCRHSKIDVKIYCPRYWKEGTEVIETSIHSFERVEKIGLSAPLAKKRKQNLYFFTNFLRLFYIINKSNTKFLYVVNTTNSILCFQVALIGFLCRKPVIAWASRLEPRNFFSTFGFSKGLIFTTLRWLNQKFISGVHATSEKAKEALIYERHKCPIYVAPTHGVPPQFERSFTREVKRNGSSIKIGYVGELRDFKGIDILIKSVAALYEEFGMFSLTIVGVGPELDRLKALSANLCLPVKFSGYIGHESMPEVYAGLDVVVLPSRGNYKIVEKFGRVLIEAAACGCAIMGSNVGGIPLAVGSAGSVFKDGDVDGLKTLIKQCVDSDSLFKLQQLAYVETNKRYSMEEVSNLFYMNVYKGVA